MAKDGATIKEIVRSAGYSRGLVRKVLRGQRSDIFRVRSSSLEVYLPWLDEQWAAGRRNGSELWRSQKQRGFRGCLRVVSEWSARRRRSEKMDASAISRAPSARTIARLMTTGRDQLSKAETVTVAAIESGVEPLVKAREIVTDFQAMIRRKAPAELDPWIERAKTSLVVGLANERQSRGERRHLLGLVQRPNRRSNLQQSPVFNPFGQCGRWPDDGRQFAARRDALMPLLDATPAALPRR